MHKSIIRVCGVVLMMPIALVGCLFGPDTNTSTRPQIDPPPVNAQKENAQAVNGTQKTTGPQVKASEQKKEGSTELYFLSDTGYVVPYAVHIPDSKGMVKEAMKWIVQGGPVEKVLPKGFKAILPKGTQVKGLNITDGTATIDFSKDFLKYKATDEKSEAKILSAITWSLTGFKSVKEVNIWVEGYPLETMPKFKTSAQGLTRNRGINLEMASGIDVNRSIPVTLYFMGQTRDNKIYYVPITRMINRTNHLAQATLQELVKGPSLNSNLTGALDVMTEINSVQLEGNVAKVDFGEQLLQYNSQGTASRDTINTIVLSLTENTTAKKVEITVNKKHPVSIVERNGKKVLQPVLRPERINPQGL